MAGAAAPVAWAELSSITLFSFYYAYFSLVSFLYFGGKSIKISFFVLFSCCCVAYVGRLPELLLLLLLPLPAAENKLTPHTYTRKFCKCECVCAYACACLCACVSPFLFCAAIHTGTFTGADNGMRTELKLN